MKQSQKQEGKARVPESGCCSVQWQGLVEGLAGGRGAG